MPRKTEHRVYRRLATGEASMRPRPDAAENRHTGDTDVAEVPRFNEAAARCRGKPNA